MAIRVLPYVTVDIDERLRRRARRAADALRLTVRARLLSAADDVDTAGEKVRHLCDTAVTRAVHRVDDVVSRVNDRIDPTGAPTETPEGPRLQAV